METKQATSNTMSDSQKVLLISRIITDFWEFNDEQNQKDGAMALITAICSIVDYGDTNG